MRAFFIVWAGQLVSVTGTSLTGFGLQVWVFLETGSVTKLALVTLARALPSVVLGPIAGVLVDRWDRRRAMLGADVLAAAATLLIAALFITDSLALWHIYLLVGVGEIGNAFQVPAWMAAVSLLVPKRHLGRANGLVQLNDGVSLVVAPALGGVLLVTTGLGGILLIDVVTFVVGIATLLAVRFPPPEASAETAPTGSMRRDVAVGWRYLRERRGLLWLLFIYAGVNFVFSISTVLFLPLVLAFGTEADAGWVLTAGGFGVIAASLAVGSWGVPSRKVLTVMGGIFLDGLFFVLVGWKAALPTIIIGIVLMFANGTLVNAASQVIWQSKVAPAVQGRVFALRRMLAQFVSPLGILLAGPLADNVFEPLMAPGGALAGSVGSLIGTGPGRGIGLLVIITGLLASLLGMTGWLHARVRNLETELPDQLPEDTPSPVVTA
jgi:MFS family permease